MKNFDNVEFKKIDIRSIKAKDDSFFLCKELIPGYLEWVTSEYATPKGYFVDEDATEEFDKQFPYKEKLKLPGQLF